MKKLVFVVALSFALFSAAQGQLGAQALPRNAAAVAAQGATESVADRSRALSQLFNDIWQDKLKHQPEYATYLGDKRYDAELTDYSPRAVNEALEEDRRLLLGTSHPPE